jgi:hypothetical protein
VLAGIAVLVVLITQLKVHPFLALMLGSAAPMAATTASWVWADTVVALSPLLETRCGYFDAE